ncbi:hypothetical protein SIID45300_03063 [Candidatus Magnetaquicoccaceae bacterium FCR-1]|uniref:Methyltransferase domain-containing protein n=1 Tax=Candidatus Magnetaquiglobus chichijimensis TaxID=3141448 RepID=A0ABQ0CCT5_9PROT
MPTPSRLDPHLVALLGNHLPTGPARILEIGCGTGHLGAFAKARDPNLIWHGIEADAPLAWQAKSRLDRLFTLDIERDGPPDLDAPYDCILLNDTLTRLVDPLACLTRLRPWLQPQGHLLAVFPNTQHHATLTALLAGEFPPRDPDPTPSTIRHRFTFASAIRLLLDAGLLPLLAEAPLDKPDDGLILALQHAFNHVKMDPMRGVYYLSASHFLFKGLINSTFPEQPTAPSPLSFIVPTNQPAVLKENFLASPIFQGHHPHQLILLEGQPSASDAIRTGLGQARHDQVIYAHQDVYLPTGWDRQYLAGVARARALDPHAGVFGVYGVATHPDGEQHHGVVVDRHWLRVSGGPFPTEVHSFDELLIGFDRLGFPGTDPRLGYHLYGTDIVCAYRERGMRAWALHAPCFHNSGLGLSNPPELLRSAEIFQQSNWKRFFPLATTCLRFG